MARPKDLYSVLGVSKTATKDEIRKAYRALARKHHPDVNKEPDAAKRFNEIQEAYDVLSDDEKRKLYDQFGHAGVNAGFGSGGNAGGAGRTSAGGPAWNSGAHSAGAGPDLGSIFEEIFGGQRSSPFGGRAPSSVGNRGENLEREIFITFQTAVSGGKEQVQIAGPRGPETVDVTIPKGIESGRKLRLRGKGHGGARGGPRGDLILSVRVGEHPWFRREGLDVLIDLPLTIVEATVGTIINIPLLKGSVALKVPAGTASGQKLRVRGKGLESESGQRGDFYAVTQIVPPELLEEADANWLRSFGERLKNPRQGQPWTDNSD